MIVDRAGYTEQKLSTVLANPDIPRDRKDFEISMYLYQRGAPNTSMLVDLMRYKGLHTKDTQVFKSQIRFDFEQFVDSFTGYLSEMSRLIGATFDVDIEHEMNEYKKWLELPNNKGKKLTYKNFHPTFKKEYITLIEMAIRAREESEVLKKNVRNMAEARMRDKGKGIYISAEGIPYTMEDPQMDEAVKKDRESTAEAEKEI
jgi:hypothetical protein